MAAKQKLNFRDKQRRVEASATLVKFRDFLYREGYLWNERRAMSPMRALDHLKNLDVRGLLTTNQYTDIEKAAKLLL